MENRSLEQRVADLEAREAIKELRARYGWHAARGEFGHVADLFGPDGVFEFRGVAERHRLVGREVIRATLTPTMSPLSVIPLLHNHIIRIEGDEAQGSCAMESPILPGSPDRGFVGYYHDRARKYDGVWLFSERIWFTYKPVFEDSLLDFEGKPRDSNEPSLEERK